MRQYLHRLLSLRPDLNENKPPSHFLDQNVLVKISEGGLDRQKGFRREIEFRTTHQRSARPPVGKTVMQSIISEQADVLNNQTFTNLQ